MDSPKLYNCSTGSAPPWPKTTHSKRSWAGNWKQPSYASQKSLDHHAARRGRSERDFVQKPHPPQWDRSWHGQTWAVTYPKFLNDFEVFGTLKTPNVADCSWSSTLHSSKFQLQHCSLAGLSQQELQMWDKLWTHLPKSWLTLTMPLCKEEPGLLWMESKQRL